MSCKSAQKVSCPITFLWLWPATDHEPHSWHMPTNTTWRWTETTPQSRWWPSHMAGINSDHSTREMNYYGCWGCCVCNIRPGILKEDNICLLIRDTATNKIRDIWDISRTYMRYVRYTLCLKKKLPTFKLSVTLSNVNRFSKFLHCWKAYEICYKTYMALPTSP